MYSTTTPYAFAMQGRPDFQILSLDPNARVYFAATQDIGGFAFREVAIYQMPGSDVFTTSSVDIDGANFENHDFRNDEEFHTLHQAYSAVFRDWLIVPLNS